MTSNTQVSVDRLLQQWSYRSGAKESEHSGRKNVWKTMYSYWMKFARLLGRVNAMVFLTIFYFLLIGPAALVLKVFGRDLLGRRAEDRASYWYDKEQEAVSVERSKHQF